MPCKSVTPSVTAVAAAAATSIQTLWGQCGGSGYSGATSCSSGAVCTSVNQYYYQCVSGDAAVAATSVATQSSAAEETTVAAASTTSTSAVVVSVTPSTSSTASAAALSTSSAATAAAATTSTTAAAAAATSSSSSAAAAASSSSSQTSSAATSTTTGQTQFAGVNIAGFDFGCDTTGTCTLTSIYPPLADYNSGPDGIGQMTHFFNDDNLNIFRLPVSWQFLVNDVVGGDLDTTNLALYDELVQGCLGTGAYCIIDIHNYARWNSEIIGQGGPTNDEFASLWSQLATTYANETKIWFGIMNEPHDLTITTWADTVQAAVTAIREAGATTQYISLPGDQYQSAAAIVTDGGGAALSNVTNPDGTTTGLIFDVHKYLDSDNSGTSTECVTDNIDDAFEPLAAWLRGLGRQAILTETGGGNTASCEQYLCSEIDYINENSDVFLGYVGWAAGGFDDTYALDETPTLSGSTWTDTALVSACLAR
ncbi:glycoside hydrolase superfamily [Xylariales sp. PMI_506]|nr:glycoside hydrolase superfamily [Xylariales sp. PMI_506]